MLRRLFPNLAVAFERMTFIDYGMLIIALAFLAAPLSQIARLVFDTAGLTVPEADQ